MYVPTSTLSMRSVSTWYNKYNATQRGNGERCFVIATVTPKRTQPPLIWTSQLYRSHAPLRSVVCFFPDNVWLFCVSVCSFHLWCFVFIICNLLFNCSWLVMSVCHPRPQQKTSIICWAEGPFITTQSYNTLTYDCMFYF